MNDIQAWLDKLGAMGTDEIRRLLIREDCKGLIGIAHRCPVATFLHQKTGTDVRVGLGMVATGDGSYQLPVSVGRFVISFDSLRYPELISKD